MGQQDVTEALRLALLKMFVMTPDERVEFMRVLAAQFCAHCGKGKGGDTCHCENEE